MSGMIRENLSDQSVYEYDKHKTQGRRKPSTSLEPSFGGAAFSTANECSSLQSRRPKQSLADTFMCMPENPFADTTPSGDTPSSATQEDPMQDIARYSHVVTAKHKPRVARMSGINGAWPERAELVDPSRGFHGPVIPRGTFSQAKAFFLKSIASGGDLQGAISQRTRSQDNPIKDKDSIDYHEVDVPRARSLNGTQDYVRPKQSVAPVHFI